MSEILAFAPDHVCRLTGLSRRQLRYWDETAFFSPTVVTTGRRAFGRVYSFRDVVGLRTISILRNEHRVPLQELRRVGSWLLKHSSFPWAALKLGLAGRAVVFVDPSTGATMEANDAGQTVLSVELIANDVRREAEKLRERTGDEIGKLSRNRFVVHNAWVVAGTRIPSRSIWRFHEAGYDVSKIVAEYPRLTRDDVRAAIEFEKTQAKAA